MRFVHTADWQIGMKAAHVGRAGLKVRETRIATARQAMEEAKSCGAEFVVLAGDTFEDNGVDRTLVRKVADLLAAFGGPVYVLPGNHDPRVPGSVWEHPAWQEQDRVRILTDSNPLEIPGGILYPCPVLSRHSTKDPTAWIDKEPGTGIRVGVAHGTVEGIRQDEPDYPIPRDAAGRTGLDYLALGHWHSTARYADPSGVTRMAYSGTPEATGFGERASGNILLVEIDKPGAPPSVTEIRTGRLNWLSLAEELRLEGDLARLRQRVEAVQEPSETLMVLSLAGLLSSAERSELSRLKEIVEARFLYGRVEDARLRPMPEDERWLEGLPAGFLREAADRLRALSDPQNAGASPGGASPEAAGRALIELCSLAQEAES